MTKLEYAEQLVAALSLLLLRQRDAVGLVRFDAAVRSVIPPRSRTGQWRRLLAALADPGSGTETKAGVGLAQAARLVRRAGMVMLVSDLLVEQEEVEEALRGLRAAGHDVTVLHVLDPAERDLGLMSGEAVFEDPESGLAVPAVVGEVRDAYRATVDAALDGWRATCARLGARYVQVQTDTPFGVPLRHAFAARTRAP